ncbi:triose-phosphate isomerase [Brumicola nitratireducens]|uniref:Triosephosphate isomerase n=1 Tax=Glaciecola nitratireducens (strain JCM 12485 / KCTC 12276 / FR1064) TaxID=1085623 RepID=G4QGY8_GLANF|nr:triose-phosphate isomerase [Glaciecola nitratireducens]AEP30176.1 triosephosphate isomerase [Glaciecola nitratireducens FR1064]
MTNSKRRPFVAGNWKMNGSNELVDSFSLKLASNPAVDVVICPPAVYLSKFSHAEFDIGAQNASEFASGAHTGEISLGMISEAGCKYVILGHSERREGHAESNEIVARKVKAAIAAGLTPIICVGEPLEVRESGNVFAFVKAQLDAVANECGADYIKNSVIAYEPIWAIGTGKTASPEQAQEVHAFIRKELAALDTQAAASVRLLYGGSVNAANAKELFAKPDIDGGLIGGASLKIEDFTTICQAAS